MFLHEYGWFLAFWLLVTALCLTEAFWPVSGKGVDRASRWPVNFGFGILNGLLASLVPSLTILAAIWAANRGIGALNLLESPLWLAIPATLIVKSFAQYAFHRCFHFFPVLWRIHRVHHSDHHLDASSALRFHPLEMVAAVLFVVPFVLLAGLPPDVLAGYEVAQLLAGLITHANISIPSSLERRARLLFVTPVLHRFHHSASETDADSNFSDVFSVWDRLFGTFNNVPDGRAAPERFGTADVDASSAGNFVRQLKLPLERSAG